MALIYDDVLFQEFRAKAVTKVEDLEVGKTYWSNEFPDVFTVASVGLSEIPPDSYKIITTTGRELSCRDRNIGDSYNPWLIFADEEIAKDCEARLRITYESDDTGWYYNRDQEYIDN